MEDMDYVAVHFALCTLAFERRIPA
jgi:hypothetical protein